MTITPTAYSARGTSPTNPSLQLTLTDAAIKNRLLDRLAVRNVVAAPRTEIPGRLTDTAGEPVTTGSGSIQKQDGSVVVSPVSPSRIPLRPGPLRAVQIFSPSSYTDRSDGFTLHASVKDQRQRVLATGALSGISIAGGRWTTIPIAGEGIAPASGPLVLELTVEPAEPGGATDEITIGASGQAPAVRVVNPDPDGLRLVYSDKYGTLWNRTTALPRIRWANSSLVLPNLTERLQALQGPNVSAHTVVLNEPGPTPPPGPPAKVEPISDTGDTVTVNVNAQAAGYLVVADAIQDNWNALIDGRSTKIYSADQAFGAVFVPAGKHEVVLSYGGGGVKTGGIISGVGIAIIVAVLVFVRLRRRHLARFSSRAGD